MYFLTKYIFCVGPRVEMVVDRLLMLFQQVMIKMKTAMEAVKKVMIKTRKQLKEKKVVHPQMVAELPGAHKELLQQQLIPPQRQGKIVPTSPPPQARHKIRPIRLRHQVRYDSHLVYFVK